MKVYADRPARAGNQLLGDALVAGWVLLWLWAGKQLHDVISSLATPGEKAEAAGRKLQSSLGDAGRKVGDLPLAGDDLRKPFDQGAASGRELAEAAQSYQESVARLAVLAGILVALAPIALVLAIWLPRRLAWIDEASAVTHLLSSHVDAVDLLALRALAHRPLHELARASGQTAGLVEAWRSRDARTIDRLARLELDVLGISHSPRPAPDVPAG